MKAISAVADVIYDIADGQSQTGLPTIDHGSGRWFHEKSSSLEKNFKCSFEAVLGANSQVSKGIAEASFCDKPYAKPKKLSPALKRQSNVVNKQKTIDIPKKMTIVSLDHPGFQRLARVLEIIPVSRATWYEGIKEGRYPPGIPIGKRSVAWSNASLKKLIEDLTSQTCDSF